MSLFDGLGQQPQFTRMNPVQIMQQLRSNPSVTLKQIGLDIPEGMSDPHQIVNHLLQSGQIPQARYQQAMQMMSRMGRR